MDHWALNDYYDNTDKVLRRSYSSEERLQQQMDVLKNEVGELKLSVQSNCEKQKLFEATVRSEIYQSELANLKTTLTLIGLLCGFASVMMCLYQVAPPYTETLDGAEPSHP